MTLRIEDFALIGDCKTAALVGRDGSIDWLCWPRFDSAACFAAPLGDADNGRWLLAPKDPLLGIERRYRPGTLVLETEFQTESGSAAVIDFMVPADGANLVRTVTGRSGRVIFQTELVVRFNYGATVPWVSRLADNTINAIAGPERLVLRTPTTLYGEDLKTVGEFAVEAGESVAFVLSYGPSFQDRSRRQRRATVAPTRDRPALRIHWLHDRRRPKPSPSSGRSVAVRHGPPRCLRPVAATPPTDILTGRAAAFGRVRAAPCPL
jgi:GH15 family glucan-1,4-alpha-glucosidase